jgi:hypothetical protein
MNKRTAYRRRAEKTEKKATIIYAPQGQWKSIKGNQLLTGKMFARMRLDGEEIGHDGRVELEKALEGQSSQIDKYTAARLIVLDAMQRGLIKSDPSEI